MGYKDEHILNEGLRTSPPPALWSTGSLGVYQRCHRALCGPRQGGGRENVLQTTGTPTFPSPSHTIYPRHLTPLELYGAFVVQRPHDNLCFAAPELIHPLLGRSLALDVSARK